MSYSFSVKASTKEAVKIAAAEYFDNSVVAQQPVHARDRAAVMANIAAVVDLLGDDDTRDVNISCNGYVSWSAAVDQAEAPLTSASVSCSAGFVNRE